MPDAPRILLHNDQTDEMVAGLRSAHPDAVVETCHDNASLPDKLATFQPDVVYSIRFTSTEPYPREAVLGAGGPKWLAVGGAGIDHLVTWDPTRVTVTNAAGVAADMMAEYVLGTFLHFTLDIPGLQSDKAAHKWDTARLVTPIKGKTLLIAGLGQTGQSLAARVKAFGMRVVGTRACPSAMENVDHVGGPDELLTLAATADFIAVTSPLLPATKGMIGADFLKAVKHGAILSDVSRGGVVDHAALAGALARGQIAGAALDVFVPEPLPPGDPVWELDNVLISPHCSSVHSDWAAQSFALFLDNLALWRADKPLFNIVDPARGY